ncbi:hypothetical protein ASG35_02995 [Burkholderia sp. Leaf177]|nr:hypothetical protein ASG35_02995 [Burkholderia sp. Leaf177]
MAPGVELSDPDNPGLRVRCNSSAKVFFYRYRAPDGALRQIKLGEFGAMTLAAARAALAKRKLDREQGIDPQLVKRQARADAAKAREAKRATSYTVEDLVNDYIVENLEKQKKGAEGVRLLQRELVPKLGARPAAAVTRRELQDEVIRPTMARAPRVATYLLSRIRCAYAHGLEQGRLPDDHISPTIGIKGASQVRRKRALGDSELATLLRWLPHSPYSRSVRKVLLLSLLTASRSGEIVAARWSDIDFERGTWQQHDTKNGTPHLVMLSRQALEVLKYRRELDPVFVFPSGKRKDQHINQKAVGLAQYAARQASDGAPAADPLSTGWTTHDLRRSAATGLARLGCPRVVQDRCLNHVDNSIAAIYDTHRYDEEARTWLQKWADHLTALSTPNVTSIDAAMAA